MKDKILWANYLKGILCILVFTSHFLLAFYPASYSGDIAISHNNFDYLLAKEPFAIIFNGKYFVHMFLTIGGYIFANRLLNSNDNEKDGYDLFKRYFRFVIPLFTICLITLIFYKLGLINISRCSKITMSWWLDALYSSELNIYNLFTNSFFLIPLRGDSTYSTAFWMLNYSFFGTYLVYILAAIFRNKKISILFILIPIFWLLINSSTYLSFVLGFLIAYLDNNCKFKIFNNKVLCILILFLGILLGSIPVNTSSNFEIINRLLTSSISYIFEIRKTCYEISSFFIIFGLCKLFNSNKNSKRLNCLYMLGDISFSIYLIHIVLLCTLSTNLFAWLYNLNINYDISVLITYIVSLLVLILLSYFFDKAIEKNSNKLILKIVNIFSNIG